MQLANLAHNSPQELYKILTSPNTDIKMLVSGAEVFCGETSDESLVLPVLKVLLKHMNALVRETAMIGVVDFYRSKNPPHEIIDRLKIISSTDPAANLRNYAKDILDSITCE